MRRHVAAVPAPSEFGSDIIAVPAGEPIELELTLESVLEGVLVLGRARATARGACVRCLDDVELDLDVDVQELFAYPERLDAARAAGDEEDSERALVADVADVAPTVRDAIVLALPFQPLCRPDCPGLCPTCGERLADNPDHQHEARDPRWSALAALIDREEGD
jgi:uncharacterized protein